MLFPILLFAFAQSPCLPCHPREVEGFSRSAMGNSVAPPSAEPEGTFEHAPSGGRVRIFWKNRQLQHQIEQNGLLATLPSSYAVGFGNVGKSYLVEIAGHLFQSPAAFYSAKKTWSESPGYEKDPVLDFWRAIDKSCLSCHTGSVQEQGTRVILTPITCERCHGNAEEHLRRPVPGSIINPAKLAERQRDSICEQCHLEGATTILNPGKHWGDFKPGMRLEEQQVTYVLRAADEKQSELMAVSHAEQLALSACKRGAGAKLWCGTCHDPHSPAGDHKKEINGTCGGCHSQTQLVATHKPEATNCVACHMPKMNAADISHAAITDHRILRRPDIGAIQQRGGEHLVAWQSPVLSLVNRDMALALFNLARSGRPQGSYPESFRLLAAAGAAAGDAAVEAAEGYMLLGSGHAGEAVQCFQRAVKDQDESAEYWLDLGVAQEAMGDNRSAESALQESIRRNPSDYRPYQALAELLQKENESEQGRAVVQQFLKINPQSILMRLRYGENHLTPRGAVRP